MLSAGAAGSNSRRYDNHLPDFFGSACQHEVIPRPPRMPTIVRDLREAGLPE